jgi:hypothetical protein
MNRLREFLSHYDMGAFVGTALFAIFYLGIASPLIVNAPTIFSSHEQQIEQSGSENSEEDQDVSAPKSTEDALAQYTLWLVVFTAVLALSTIGLWLQTTRLAEGAEVQAADIRAQIKATEDMARASQQSANAADKAIETQTGAWIKQLRPFVSVKGFITLVALDNEIDRNIQGFHIRATLENTGQTPAINLTSRISIAVFPNGMPERFSYPETYAAEDLEGDVSFIGSHSSANSGVLILSLSDALAAPNQLLPVYIWGAADYDDTFDGTPRYRTEFSARVDLIRELDPVPVAQPVPEYLLISVRGPHNGVDGACMHLPNPSKKHPNSDKPEDNPAA